VRDYLHVDDAATGVLTLADGVRHRAEVRGEAFNFASRDRLTVLQIVERILRLMGSSLEPSILGLALAEIPEQRVSTAKARRILGWKPQVSLEAGLRETVEWYRTHLAAIA
jgi:CDP-glucose 4,6-dehydratase